MQYYMFNEKSLGQCVMMFIYMYSLFRVFFCMSVLLCICLNVFSHLVYIGNIVFFFMPLYSVFINMYL